MIDKPTEEPLRRSQHVRRFAISSDYVTYMSKDLNEISEMILDVDPLSYKEAIKSDHSSE